MKRLALTLLTGLILTAFLYYGGTRCLSTKICEAIEAHDVSEVESLLEKPFAEAAINMPRFSFQDIAMDGTVDRKPVYPLHCASRETQPQIMLTLIDKGVDLNQKDKAYGGITTLDFVFDKEEMTSEDYDCVKILDEHGYIFSATAEEENTCSYYACRQIPYYDYTRYDAELAEDSLEIYKLLTSKMGSRDNDVVMDELLNAISSNNYAIATYIVSNNPDIDMNQRYDHMITAIFALDNGFICDRETLKIAKLLIENGADPNITDDDGKTVGDYLKEDGMTEGEGRLCRFLYP